jgi:iron-sulfur cluster repair protein YtfE (RIC family)
MQPSEVRDRVLRDHAGLRELIERVESLAREVSGGERPQVRELRTAAETLLSTLLRHMDWEDRELVPALADSDAWGPERARRLSEEHVEQRQFLGGVIEGLRDSQRPPMALAASLIDLAQTLLIDMEEEEAFFLDPDVLRDDVIGINVETG